MTQRKAIVLYGAGGHGKVVADCIEKQGIYAIAGFIDDAQSGMVYGYSIVGKRQLLPKLKAQGIGAAVVTVGNPAERKILHQHCAGAGLELVAVVHPSASIARGASLGEGSVVMPGVMFVLAIFFF